LRLYFLGFRRENNGGDCEVFISKNFVEKGQRNPVFSERSDRFQRSVRVQETYAGAWRCSDERTPSVREKKKQKEKRKGTLLGCCAGDGYYLPHGAVRGGAQRAAAGPAGQKWSGRSKTYLFIYSFSNLTENCLLFCL
jgi:hypothetical protein